MLTFKYTYYDNGIFTFLYMESELEFINYSISVGSDVSVVWLNPLILEAHLTKILGCFVDFTFAARAFVILLSLIAGNWQYGDGMSTNVVTSLVHENLSDFTKKTGDIQRIKLGAQIARRMIPISFSFPWTIHRQPGPSSCLLSGYSGILVLKEITQDVKLKSFAEIKNMWSYNHIPLYAFIQIMKT